MIDFLSAIVLAGVIVGVCLQRWLGETTAQSHPQENCIVIRYQASPNRVLAETNSPSSAAKVA